MSRRKKKHQEHENHERWLVSYADFITLLFAFFVVLYATSEKDKSKADEFEKSVKKYLLKITNVGGQGEGDGGATKGVDSPIPPPIQQFDQSLTPRAKEIRGVLEQVEKYVEREFTLKERTVFIHDIVDDEWGVRVSLSSKYLFPQLSDKFRANSIKALDKVAGLILAIDKKVLIEGHTDDSQVRTTRFPSEWELAGSRATKVLRYFNVKHEVPSHKMVSLSYGSQRPLVPNTTETNKSRNDRIEILFLSGVDYF